MTEDIQSAIEGLTEEQARVVLKSLILTGRVSEGLVRAAIDLARWVQP